MKKLTWLIVILTVLLFGAMNVIEYGHVHTFSGGLKSPDLRITGYSADQFNQWLDNIGPNGAELYLRWFPNGLDMIFPALAGLSIALLVHASASRFPRYKARSIALKILFPLAVALPYIFFDYFENAVVADAIEAGGNAGANAIAFASSLTVLKFSFAAFAIIVIVAFWLASLKLNTARKP